MAEIQVTTAMLADNARVAEDGKLYIFGGQWDRILTAQLPLNHPALAIALVVKVPYDRALEPHRVALHLETEDGDVLSTPQMEGTLQTGHAPTSRRGDDGFAPLAITVSPLHLERAGHYSWVVSIDDEEKCRIPMIIGMLAS